MAEQGVETRRTTKAARIMRHYVFNSTILGALLFSSPAILSACGSFAMSLWVDREIAGLNQRRDALLVASSQLSSFKENLEGFQLNRAAMLILLNGMNADISLKYTLDKLFRLNSQDSMRRVAAILYPEGWKERMQPYEAITSGDYGDTDSISRLQAIESDMIGTAAHRLVVLQQETNALANEIDRKTSFRTSILSIGNSLMYIITILLFFAKSAKARAD